jgi:histidine triad (HIT) family protein
MPERFEENCIFCKIVAGTLPSARVYEDAQSLVFMNLQQKNPGHTLIIPKDHYPNIYELPDELASYVAGVTARIARALKKEFRPIGVNVLQNNEPAAMQSIFHYHVHVIPRYAGDDLLGIWRSGPASLEELNTNASRLKQGL